nr:hypothetical protein [Yoonia sp.]
MRGKTLGLERRHRWSDDEKLAIVNSVGVGGATVIPAIYELLEEAGYFYAIWLPANNVLREKIAHRLTRPVVRSALFQQLARPKTPVGAKNAFPAGKIRRSSRHTVGHMGNVGFEP